MKFWSSKKGAPQADYATDKDIVADVRAMQSEIERYRVEKTAELSEKNERDAALWDERVSALPDYEPKPACRRCGETGVKLTFSRPVFAAADTGWRFRHDTYAPFYSGIPVVPKHGELTHFCTQCEYTWATKTADHEHAS